MWPCSFLCSKKVGASIGLLPYSKMGYNFEAVRSLSKYPVSGDIQGTGGLNQIYGGIAWEPVKKYFHRSQSFLPVRQFFTQQCGCSRIRVDRGD
jgi:hypothetical protein